MDVRLSTVREYEYSKEPYVSISGKWLANCGFTSGKKFVIEVTDKGEIILKPIAEEI